MYITHISLKVKKAEALVLLSSPAIRGLAMEWPGVSKSWQRTKRRNLRIIYPLVMTNIAMENDHGNSGYTDTPIKHGGSS